MRVAILWPAAAPLSMAPPRALADTHSQPAPPRPWLSLLPIASWRPPSHRRGSVIVAVPPPAAKRLKIEEAVALAASVQVGPAARREDRSAARGTIPPPLRHPVAAGGERSRLAGSAWLIARGGADGTLLGGQLGGSQAGARLTYALGPDVSGVRRLALSARIATPLGGRGREAAVGFDWQPTKAPLHLIAEQRLSLDGGRGGPTLLAVGGIGPTPVAAGFRLEAYAQAGAIARDGIEAFGDGAARLTRPIVARHGVRFDLGIGAWGAGQRGARRLDIGPTAGFAASIGREAMRLTLDWRERVAGQARPGSGPALSLGLDF